MTQLFLAIFGLSALSMAYSTRPCIRKWSPICGLAAQPFWLAFALDTDAWGLLALVGAYTVVYLRGALVQWRIQP